VSAVDADTSAPRSTFARAREWIDDRINPILVKEVRQALRGRYFRNLFWFTVVAATGVSVLSLLSIAGEQGGISTGPRFFVMNFAVMIVAIGVFVPFWAFQSMGGEWEENTYDLLVISNLRPGQLILGKAFAAAVQALLCFSAFAPYLVSTFLMGGVDLVSLSVALAASLCMSVALSLFAVCAATFARSRLVRGFLALVVIAVLLWVSGTSFAFSFAMIEQPEILRLTGVGTSIGAALLPTLMAACFCLAVGCARLAHEHENRSTPLRVVVGLTTLAFLANMVWGGRGSVGMETPIYYAVTILSLLFFMTEAEPLGRRAEKQVPASRLLALLSLPFLPGGGRGVWLYLATWAVTLVAVILNSPEWGWGAGVLYADLSGMRAFFAYGFVLIGLLSGIASFRIRSLKGRNGVRLAIPLLFLITFLGPVLLGLIFDIESWMEFEHPLNPFMLVQPTTYPTPSYVVLGRGLLVAGALLTLLINAPRLRRSVQETLRASEKNRAAARIRREGAHAS
jgi:ABC-type transport system involved in multi-copper enzyme maturation permease subunit